MESLGSGTSAARLPTAPKKRILRRVLRIAAFVLALALVLFATMAVLVDSEAVIRRVADAALPRASTILGRGAARERAALARAHAAPRS
jgi:hypothetical protein